MIRRLAFVLLVLLAAFGATGCSKKHKIHVESDTCWRGLVNRDLLLDNCQNATYEVQGKLEEVRLSKTTQNGYLRLWIEGGRVAETTEPFGTVTVRK